MTTKKAAPVDIEDMDNALRSVTRRYRGHTFVIRELPMKEYNKTVRLATTKDEETGEETFDSDAHTAIMLGKCVTVDGRKTTAEDLYELGTALVRQLQRDASALHFDPEVEQDPKDDDEGEAPARES